MKKQRVVANLLEIDRDRSWRANGRQHRDTRFEGKEARLCRDLVRAIDERPGHQARYRRHFIG